MKSIFKNVMLAAFLLIIASVGFSQQGDKKLNGDEKSKPLPNVSSEVLSRPFDFADFLRRERNGEIPSQAGKVISDKSQRIPFRNESVSAADVLVNNNAGAIGTGNFTQSETSILAFGNNVVIGFNDAGSNAGGSNKFTGWSYSSDGGATFTDGGTLPTNAGGDAGDPVLARNSSTGRIYFSTLGFSISTIQVFRSDNNGVTWLPPVNGTPGGSSEDKQWMDVDNFPGPGNGNVYLMSRRFGANPGIYMFRSTDNGNTFGPNLGVNIVAGTQGAFVAVGPDHSVYAFWYGGTTLLMRKSTDFGLTFAAPVIVASGLVGGVNGDLALTGIRQGTATASGFRSNEFPHVAVNPVSGHLYVTYANNPAGADKADIFMVMSTDGGATWSAAQRVNDDVTTTDQWQPTIAVTPDGNSIGIFYYSRQEDAENNNLFKYYGRTGVISGSTVTFTPSFAISDAPSLPEFGRDAVINSVYMGDYDFAVATPGKFHVVWADNRDDLAGGPPRKDPNIYYESIPAGLLTGPNISVTPANVNFGAVAVTATGGPTVISVVNIGDAPVTISSITSPALDFALSTPALPVVIPSLGSINLSATFSPAALGAQNSSFTITSNAINNPTVVVNLAGTGVTNINVTPTLVDFGSVPVGQTVGPNAVTIQNRGTVSLTISNISAPSGDFSLTNAALPIVLPAAGTTTVNTFFSPTSPGAKTSSFDILSNAIGTPSVTVNLQGTGIVAPPNDLCSNAIPINCGSSIVGTTVLATFDNVGTCGTSNTSPGVWYTVIGTGAPITVSTCTAASYDTKLSVFRGTCVALVCVGGNDDGCSSLRSQVTFNSVRGTTYYVLVHGFQLQTGTFTLSTSACPAEIDVTPAPLVINVPIDGSTTANINIANTANSGSLNLLWSVRSQDGIPISIQGNQALVGMQPYVRFQITSATLAAIRSAGGVRIIPPLSVLTSEPPMEKEAFVNMIINAIGGPNTQTFYQVIMENSILFIDEIKGLETNITGSGGPDPFGYEFKDSDEPGGPVFNWIDITGTGTAVTLTDDASILVPLPFTFNFYGVNKTQIRIGSNGYLTFGTSGTTFINTSIPNTAVPNDIICPFWDDLDPELGGTIHYRSTATQFIVQYTNIRRFLTNQPNTFQVILNADGSILYQYLDMQGALNSSTVGIENSVGTLGLQVVFNAAYIHNNLAVRISIPPACSWISSITPNSGTTVPGATSPVAIGIDATGLSCGTHNCGLRIFSNAANAPVLTIPVILNVGNPTCSITSVPSNNIYTGGIPTNLYIGYGPQSTTLQVNGPTCRPPYTYAWSGGTLSNYNTPNPVFTATTEGVYTFTVVITDADEVNTTCSISITVTDIRVPGTNGNKVYLCHAPPDNPANTQTLSVSINAVQDHMLSHSGDRLGKCPTSESFGSTKSITEPGSIVFKVTALPNPADQYFNIRIESVSTEPVILSVFDISGRKIYSANVSANTLHRFGERFISGVYMAEVRQGDNVSKIKLIKQ